MTERAHSRVGASSSKRWLACPGSVALSAALPEAPTNEYQAEGTAAHNLAEMCLRLGDEPSSFLGELLHVEKFVFTVDAEMVAAVAVYLDHVRGWIKGMPGCTIFIERRLTLSKKLGMFGTADILIVDSYGTFAVLVDYKHGAGVAVEVVSASGEFDNSQLAYYGSAAKVEFPNLKKIRVDIAQPRCPHEDGPIRGDDLIERELDQWTERLIVGAEEAKKPDAPRRAGAHCRWCPALARCPTAHDHTQEQAMIDFEPVGEPKAAAKRAAELLKPAELTQVLNARPFLSAYVKAVESEAHRLLSEDLDSVPDWKRVRGTGNRRWTSWSEAQRYLTGYGLSAESLLVPGSPISPAAAEKLLKGQLEKDDRKTALEGLAHHFEKPPGKVKLVSADAPGEPIKPGEAATVVDGEFEPVES